MSKQNLKKKVNAKVTLKTVLFEKSLTNARIASKKSIFKKLIVFTAFNFFLSIAIFKDNEIISNSSFELTGNVIKKIFYSNKIFLKNFNDAI